MHPVSCTTTHHGVTDLLNHGMVKNGENGPAGYEVFIRIGMFLVQTQLGAPPGLGTQTCYEAPGDL